MKRSLSLAFLTLLTACAPAVNLGTGSQPLRGSAGLSQGLLNPIPSAQVTPQTSPDTYVRLPGCPDASIRLGDVQALGDNGPALACQRVQQVQAGSYVAGSVLALAAVGVLVFFFAPIIQGFSHP